MPRQTCKVCDLPDNGAAIVDALLDKRMKLRDIAEQVGLSKSSVHRHSQSCYVRRKAGSLRSRIRGRKLVQHICEKTGQASPITTLDGRPVSSSEILPSDTLYVIEVVYTQPEITNPSALKPENLRKFLDKLRPADRPGVEAMMKSAGLPVAEALALTEPEKSAGDASECEREPSQEAPEPAPPPEPVKWDQSSCQHVMRPIPGGQQRCELCGFQPRVTLPVSQSRRDLPVNSRNTYGRFGEA